MNEDKYHVIARVRCMGKTHNVGLSKKGRLTMFDHEGETEETISMLQVFNPDYRCRCREIGHLWRWYIKDKFYWHDLQVEHPWVREQFTDRWGRPSQPSDSKLLEALPKPLRPFAQEMRELHSKRGHEFYYRRDAYGRSWGENILIKPNSFKENLYNKWTRQRRRGQLLHKRMLRVMNTGGADISQLPLSGNMKAMRDGNISKEQMKSHWFKYLTSQNMWPHWAPLRGTHMWGNALRSLEEPLVWWPTVVLVRCIQDGKDHTGLVSLDWCPQSQSVYINGGKG